jgi:hypothetical protein
MAIRNPAAVKILLGWGGVAAITLGGLALMGFVPPHPGFYKLFLPAVMGVLIQGLAALMAVRRGFVQMAWMILLVPLGLSLLLVLMFVILFAAGSS